VGLAALFICSAALHAGEPHDRSTNTILLTGFEPFGGLSTNTSWEVARRIDGARIGDKRVVAVKIPVVWEEARAAIARAVRRHDPDIAIVMGVAWWGVVAVEDVGRNERGSHPDNKGERPSSYEIYPRGPRHLRTRLPTSAILKALTDRNLPCRRSDTAGTYLCNEALYTILYETRSRPVTAGLLHLPRAGPDRARKPTKDERAVRAVSLDELVEGIRAALGAAATAHDPASDMSQRLLELRRAHGLAPIPTTTSERKEVQDGVRAFQDYFTHGVDEASSLPTQDPRRGTLAAALSVDLTKERARILAHNGLYGVVYWATCMLGRLHAIAGERGKAYHEFDDVLAVDTSRLPASARAFLHRTRRLAFAQKARSAFMLGDFQTAIDTVDSMLAAENFPAAANASDGAAALLLKAESLMKKSPADADAALAVLALVRVPPYVAHARALSRKIRRDSRR
jgi:pyroglutamyl-peptidase